MEFTREKVKEAAFEIKSTCNLSGRTMRGFIMLIVFRRVKLLTQLRV